MTINARMNPSKFSAAVLGEGAHELYADLYGEKGEGFLHILNNSPDEVAVISRMIAYLQEAKGDKNGHSEDFAGDRTV